MKIRKKTDFYSYYQNNYKKFNKPYKKEFIQTLLHTIYQNLFELHGQDHESHF